MATIPLQLARRRLDNGNAVQYPDRSPVGGAMQELGGELQQVAEHYEQRKAQQQAFDTEIAARKLNGEIARAEADAVANAPADGADLHDAMYGMVDPRTGRVVKPGAFDTLLDNFLQQAPAEVRPGLARRREALRAAGSVRMAVQQYQRRQQYEQDQLSEVQTAELDAIANNDPNDNAAFDAARQRGLDVLGNMNLDPQSKLKAEADWRESTAKARIEALIAENPQRALNLLGLTAFARDESHQPAPGMDGITTGSVAQTDSSDAFNGKGERVHKRTPSERIGQAFLDDVPIDALRAELSPGSYDDVIRQAHAANAASLISTHADIDIAAQNARAAITNMAPYSGPRPDDTQFASAFGAEEGGKRSRTFNWRADVSPYLADMRVMPTSQVDVSVFAAKPAPNRFSRKQDPELYRLDQVRHERDQRRYELNADAAALIIQQRQVDPAAYARKVIPSVNAAFKNLSTPQDLQAAVALSFAAQRQLGITKPQPLPRSDAEGLIRVWKDTPDPEEAERTALAAVADPKQRKALVKQLADIKAAQSATPAAPDGEAGADGSDAAELVRPATKKFAKSIDLSPADILRLKKAVMTEWDQRDKEVEAKGLVDEILNRVASGKWGKSVEGVVNAYKQYSDVNGPPSWKRNRIDVDQLPVDDARFARTSNLVDKYLAERAAGAPSVVGSHLQHANPGESDAENQDYISKFDGPILGRHHHGTEKSLQPYRPAEFSINLPEDYYPAEP